MAHWVMIHSCQYAAFDMKKVKGDKNQKYYFYYILPLHKIIYVLSEKYSPKTDFQFSL